jgi:hypothetical protein
MTTAVTDRAAPAFGALGLANIALALALAFSIVGSMGVKAFLTPDMVSLLRDMHPTQAHLVVAFVQYLVPAAVAYGLLLLTRPEKWLRPRPAIHGLLLLSNLTIVLLVLVRAFAAGIQGGGASYVLGMFLPLVVSPARLVLVFALGWLVFRSAKVSVPELKGGGLLLTVGMVAYLGYIGVSYATLAYSQIGRLLGGTNVVLGLVAANPGPLLPLALAAVAVLTAFGLATRRSWALHALPLIAFLLLANLARALAIPPIVTSLSDLLPILLAGLVAPLIAIGGYALVIRQSRLP